MKWLVDVIVQLLKWVLPMIVHEIVTALKKWNDERKEQKHKQAVSDLKESKNEEEQREATRDLANNP